MTTTDPAPPRASQAAWFILEFLVLPTVLVVGNHALGQAHASEQERLLANLAYISLVAAILWPRVLRRDVRRQSARARTGTGFAAVLLAVVLGTAVLLLTELLATWVGLGSLGYLSGRRPGDGDPTLVYLSVAARGLPLTLGAAFLLSVAVGHRLRGRARTALHLTAAGFTVGALTLNQALAAHWGTVPMPEDRYVPVVTGALCWAVGRIALWYAARTQDLYDALYATRARVRNTAGPN
ncbi:hypothetical protein [Streptomyces flavofungini]|uniref:hypothetical protein n=1 Tax=Streptomyces flavofungini TaxID=68200 RepID=UPI0034DEC4A3